jgi:hypothetical protein
MEYARSAQQLWMRARREGDEVLLEAQERMRVRDGMATAIGADGEVRWEAAVQVAPPPGAWYEVGRVRFGAPWERLGIPLLDWPLVVRGVQRHLVRLAAGGWGETVADVAAMFEDPLADGTCLAAGVYRIDGEYAPLVGFAGFLLRVDPVEDEVVRGTILGLQMPPLEGPVAQMVLALLVAGVPVSE